MPDLQELTFHEARRFSLAVVFVDINNSGSYLTDHGARGMLYMLNMFIPEIMELVEENEGYFEKNTGDGILAYFGAGEPNEVAVESILRYLADVRYALSNHINPELKRYGLDPISISAGASYAEDVHISRVGIRGESRRVAISNAANAAFVLEQKAGKNEFLVDDGVYRNANRNQGFGQYLNWAGVLEKFEFGSERTGYKPVEYYNFDGYWESTTIDNI